MRQATAEEIKVKPRFPTHSCGFCGFSSHVKKHFKVIDPDGDICISKRCTERLRNARRILGQSQASFTIRDILHGRLRGDEE